MSSTGLFNNDQMVMIDHACSCRRLRALVNVYYMWAMLWFVRQTAMSVPYTSHDPELGVPETHKRLPRVPEESSSEVLGMVPSSV